MMLLYNSTITFKKIKKLTIRVKNSGHVLFYIFTLILRPYRAWCFWHGFSGRCPELSYYAPSGRKNANNFWNTNIPRGIHSYVKSNSRLTILLSFNLIKSQAPKGRHVTAQGFAPGKH